MKQMDTNPVTSESVYIQNYQTLSLGMAIKYIHIVDSNTEKYISIHIIVIWLQLLFAYVTKFNM